MRGRSLRLDPADAEKIASNWDVVCVAPELARGDADYERFVRKHVHLFAPSEDGAIEAGPSHVHPSLSPFAPPPASDFDEINREMVHRARDHKRARARWAIGEPYLGEEHETLVVRPRRAAPIPKLPERPPAYPVAQRLPLTVGATAAVATPLAAASAGEPLALIGLTLLPMTFAWALSRLARVRQQLQEMLPLDLAAYAVRDAYLELGELSGEAAASVAIEPRASGYMRVWLKKASAEETATFTAALNDVVDPPPFPRYLVSRLVPGRRSALGALARVLTGRRPFEERWSAVPADLGRRKDRAQAFERAWTRWLGPTRLVFTQRTETGKSLLAAANAQARAYEARTRRVWL
jgi:hypothetical protein